MPFNILKVKCCFPTSTPRSPDSCWSWLVCMAGALTWAWAFGISQCYGVPMPVIIDRFNSTREATAWAGSIPGYLTFAGIPLCSKIIAIINFRSGALLGAAMCVVSLILTSFTTSLLQVFFSYSIIYGLGCSMIYTSSINAVTQYFKKRQGLALGIFTGGLNLGVLSIGPLLQLLINLYGLQWMFRIVAFPFSLLLLMLLSYDPNIKRDIIRPDGGDEVKEKKLTFCDALRKLLRRPQYVISVLSLTMQTLTAFVSFVHLVNYCKEVGIPPSKAANLFIPIGISSLLSSLITGRVVDIPSANPLHVNQVGALSLALSMLLVQLATEYYHFVIFSVFLGVGIGVLVTTIVVIVLNTVEPVLRSVSFSFGQFLTSFGNLTGPPFIGFIADKTGSYKPAFFTAGGICLVSFFLLFLQHCFKPWREAVRAKEIELGEYPATPDAQEIQLKSPSQDEDVKLLETTFSNPKMMNTNQGEREKVSGDDERVQEKEKEDDRKQGDDKEKEDGQEKDTGKENLQTNQEESNETTPLNPE